MTIETKANRFLTSESELATFLAAWEAGTLPKVAWTHAAHVAAAAAYTWRSTPAEALPLLRLRIRTYNEATGGRNTDDSGYHETLTRFWTEVVGRFVTAHQRTSRLDAVRAAVERFGGDRELPQTYYTHDLVRDKVARREWVPPQKLAEFTAFCAGLANAISSR
jgi:hypothetical protein